MKPENLLLRNIILYISLLRVCKKMFKILRVVKMIFWPKKFKNGFLLHCYILNFKNTLSVNIFNYFLRKKSRTSMNIKFQKKKLTERSKKP